ncbi:hypothetical protein [Vibrio phage VH7D]|uniref:Uncharacterized protein n=1 Tax=Vibrio phage VH7D TaxID=1262539 RepID=V9LYT3_9CAUD|nr:hypothetical protein CF80_gp082 [Vibrio phage VH7D]QBX06277.1 hypothetical protein Va3_324 [Vibrio phage Va3]QNJ54904.1 hypothetical protein vBValMR10Z_364 [Vibrio phage vB_ValM_R10Z]QNJ55289.1 hypothetical protein vBValMR11Z_363 [Vibrio phage vB_ValM_R11Z]URQ03401.1 hypothetical protein PVA23_24 [Vibrio phage PVA23]AGB06869.1 hypothetical protein [Vibrio phage VH7D]
MVVNGDYLMRIVELEAQMKALQKEIDEERDKCRHTRVTYTIGSNDSGDWRDVRCIDCKTVHRFYSHVDILNYHMQREIGSDLSIEEEKYKIYLQVKAAIDGEPVPPYPY